MRNHLPRASTSIGRKTVFLISFALLVCCSGVCQISHPHVPDSKEKSMTHYALIFHFTRSLSPEESKQRSIDIAAWVKQVTEMGIELDPRALGETLVNLSKEGDSVKSQEGSSDPTFTNIVFFDSTEKDSAISIAKIHPGLKYGVKVELRQWTSPRAAAAK